MSVSVRFFRPINNAVSRTHRLRFYLKYISAILGNFFLISCQFARFYCRYFFGSQLEKDFTAHFYRRLMTGFMSQTIRERASGRSWKDRFIVTWNENWDDLSLPDWTFQNFRAWKFVDQGTFCCSEWKIWALRGSKMFGRVAPLEKEIRRVLSEIKIK